MLSTPDSAGEFSFERGSSDVEETALAVFLAPLAMPGIETASSDPRAGYDAFLDDIVDAAKRLGYRPEESPGQGDPRIHGLRQ